MDLKKQSYKPLGAMTLVHRASPFYSALHFGLSVICAVLPTTAMALATAGFVNTASAILQSERQYNDIFMPLFILLLVVGANTTILSIVKLLYSRMSLDLQRAVVPAVVRIHCALDYKHIEQAESWELISRVSRDPVKSLMEGSFAFIEFFQIIVSVISVLVLIVTQVWWAALIILAFSIPMFWLSMYAGKQNYQASRDAEKFNRRTEYLAGVLTGRDAADERTLFGYGGELGARWYEQYEAGRALQLKVTAKMFMINKGSSMVLALIALLVALTLIGPVVSGALSAGMFMGIVSAVFGMILQLGWQMPRSLENISKAGEYMKDLGAFVSMSGAEGALSAPEAEPMAFDSLEFKNVSFRYPGGDGLVLDGLSFSLNKGRHYAFVGRNGAGKTTITKLLTGLYADYEGEILINGKELREYETDALKALFSVVFQDFAKFNIPLKANIAVGDIAGVDVDGRIDEVVRKAGLSETVAELKEGADTPLGKILEGAEDISGGQWQRVAIARSLISRAPVKILDEPTAALDPIGESQIYGEFEKLMRGKTTIFISHRLGSTKLADDILVIDDGKLAERGAHADLMAAGGLYAGMFETQRGWYQ